jgi:hypothetical protein
MSLNISNAGRPICKIIDGKYNGRIVSVTDDTPAPDDIKNR